MSFVRLSGFTRCVFFFNSTYYYNYCCYCCCCCLCLLLLLMCTTISARAAHGKVRPAPALLSADLRFYREELKNSPIHSLRVRKSNPGPTLRASLSGTFLQILPELVTPLKGHSLSPRSCPPTLSAPSERSGY